ncbi:MAG: PadR family transcriptional regulator [Chloroflexota bacterium]
MSLQDQIRKGSTEILVLALLSEKPMYGYQISQELARKSDGFFELKEGLLYPTLHRMKQDGLLTSEWQKVGDARRRKYYAITPLGKEQLEYQSAEWHLFIEKLQAMVGNL